MKSHTSEGGEATGDGDRSGGDPAARSSLNGTVECPIDLRAPAGDGTDRQPVRACILGELTHCTQREVVDDLSTHCAMGLQLDLSLVKYFDAGGITALLLLRERCRQAGSTLHVQQPTDQVRWVLGLVGLDAELLGEPAQEGPVDPPPGAATAGAQQDG